MFAASFQYKYSGPSSPSHQRWSTDVDWLQVWSFGNYLNQKPIFRDIPYAQNEWDMTSVFNSIIESGKRLKFHLHTVNNIASKTVQMTVNSS